MRFRFIYLIFSSLLVIFGIFSIIRWGFVYSIDFSGGTNWEFSLNKEIPESEISQIITTSEGVKINSLLTLADQTYSLRASPISFDQKQEIESAFFEKEAGYQELKFESLGPSMGRELLQKTLMAVILASITILLYVGRRFSATVFGISAIIAMFHDTFLLVASFSVLGHFFGTQVDSLFVTAVLTILSFSVHDTVVVYDRIRELKRKKSASLSSIANQAVTETLTRSINNSMTIIFMLLSLVLLGGESTRWFAMALLIGTILGTYSSTFTAVPLLLVWEDLTSNSTSNPRG
jgi:preprotein translocase subunit SecF